MKSFIVYTLQGEILRTGQCQGSDLGLQGEYVMEGTANDAMQYIQDGVIVDMPPKPNDYSVFDYNTKQWVDPRTPETQWEVVRAERSKRLQETDWTQLADIYPETKALWEPYRQALRDVTSQPDPFNIIWPASPTA